MVEERHGTRLERTGGLEQIFAKATSAFTDKVAEISTLRYSVERTLPTVPNLRHARRIFNPFPIQCPRQIDNHAFSDASLSATVNEISLTYCLTVKHTGCSTSLPGPRAVQVHIVVPSPPNLLPSPSFLPCHHSRLPHIQDYSDLFSTRGHVSKGCSRT